MAKEVVYRVRFETGQARSQARALRNAIEAELRTIKVGNFDLSAMQRATGEAQRLRSELEGAAKASGNIKPPSSAGSGGSSAGPNFGAALQGGLAAVGVGLTIRQLQDLGREMVELGRRGAIFTQLKDVLNTYAASVGSSAERMLAAAQKASQGTISQYELTLNANRAIQFQVATTAEQYAKLIKLATALGRAQGVADTQALEFITTGIARESRLILDNLGLIINIKDAQSAYAQELGKSVDNLTQAEKKTALLNAAYEQGATAIAANEKAADSAATTFERFDTAVVDAKDKVGELIAELLKEPVGGLATYIAEVTNALVVMSKKTKSSTSELRTFLENANKDLQDDSWTKKVQRLVVPGGNDEDVRKGLEIANQRLLASLDEVEKALDAGLPGADKYEQQIKDIAIALVEGTMDAPTAVSNLVKVNAALAALVNDPAAKAAAEEAKRIADEKQAAMERLKLLADSEESVNQQLLKRAQNEVKNIGAERAIDLYKQARDQANLALQALQEAGVNDANEIAFKVEEITNSLMAGMDQAVQAINMEGALASFDQLNTALSGMNASFTDFLPGVSAAREELLALGNEMAFTGAMTDEQAAQLDYLAAMAAAVADSGSDLNGVVAELGNGFLSSNQYAADLVSKLFEADAAYNANIISADVYAGVTTVVAERLLAVASSAGIATGAIYDLIQAYAGVASASSRRIGEAVANRVQTSQAAQARENNRREMERYNRDQERAAKAATRHQESSARKAGKELENGAKKAAQELKGALDKVPGLFSTTQVTEQDMKDSKLGIYQEKADEYLRRLRDEVENGKDWEGVSLEEARAGLERAGLEAGATAEATLAMLERSINDQSLFAAAENIPIFINEEAVKQALELQKKSEEGRNNVYKYFGVQIDEAVDAATGGGGGGGGYTPPEIEPPKLIDIDPLTEGLQTGLDEYVNASGEIIKEQIANAPNLFFDPANLFGTTKPGGGKMGPMTNPNITVTTDPAAAALMPVVTGQVQPSVQVQLTDPTGAPANFAVQPTLADDAGALLALALGDQLGQQTEILIGHGKGIGAALLSGLKSSLSVDDKGNAQIDIAGFVGNNLNAQAKTIIAQGSGIGSLLQQGMTQAMQGETGGTQLALRPTVDAAGLQADLDALGAFTIQGKIALDAQNIITINDLVGALTPSIKPTLSLPNEALNAFATDLEARMPPVGVETNLTTSVGAMTDFTVYLEDNVPMPGIQTALAITVEEIRLFETLVGSLVKPSVQVKLDVPQPQTNSDGSAGANAITPLITDINTQIRSSQEGIMAQGATIAQILVAGMIAHFKAGQSAGGEAATPFSDALMTSLSSQLTAAQGMFYAVGFLPAGAVESGFKRYAYAGLADSFLEAVTVGVRSIAGDLSQRGGTMASYVQSGFVSAFNSETFKAQLISVGELMYSYIEIGILAKVNGGKLTTAIATQVIDDLNAEMEQP